MPGVETHWTHVCPQIHGEIPGKADISQTQSLDTMEKGEHARGTPLPNSGPPAAVASPPLASPEENAQALFAKGNIACTTHSVQLDAVFGFSTCPKLLLSHGSHVSPQSWLHSSGAAGSNFLLSHKGAIDDYNRSSPYVSENRARPFMHIYRQPYSCCDQVTQAGHVPRRGSLATCQPPNITRHSQRNAQTDPTLFALWSNSPALKSCS